MVFFHASVMNTEQIMGFYGVNFEIANYLEMISPLGVNWEEYEEIKDFLFGECLSPVEFEKAHKCLVDRMNI